MPAVLPTGGSLFYPASPRFSDSKSLRSPFIIHLLSVKASPSARAASKMPAFGKYLAALVDLAPAARVKFARAPALGELKTGPATLLLSGKKSTDKPKVASTGRSSGRPASRPVQKRKKKVKTKTSYYVKSTTNTFSLVKITAERSEKTYADRQR